MPPSILLLSEIFPPQSGGSGRWFSEIYPKITQFKTHCMVQQQAEQAAYDQRYPDQQILRCNLQMKDRAPLSLSSARRYASIARLVRKNARKLKVNQLHAARPLFEGLTTRLVNTTLRLPRVCYVHGEDISVAATSRELRLATSYALGGKATIVANSVFTQKMLTKDWKINSNRIRVINPGVDTTFFTPAPKCPSTRTKLGWVDKTVVLTVGRLQRRKGHDNFIRALSSIQKSIPNILYAIVGSGPMKSELESLAKKRGVSDAVRFQGEITDAEMLNCYQQCDLFSLPNRSDGADVEGFGMVSLEAQSCGKPALVGDSGGTPETIVQGKTGFAIDCSQPDLIAHKTCELLSEPHALTHLGQNARARAVEQFDWKAIVRRSEQLFHDIEQSR
ncbi:glycosyltransferase family 4 protein [bacterium]|nr:glycosyltransferase family 4 protein [bacterium]